MKIMRMMNVVTTIACFVKIQCLEKNEKQIMMNQKCTTPFRRESKNIKHRITSEYEHDKIICNTGASFQPYIAS